MSNYGNVKRFFHSVSMYYKTYSNRTDFDDDSECSTKEEQMGNKTGDEQDDCNTQTNC